MFELLLDIHITLYQMLFILGILLTIWAFFFLGSGRAVDGAFRSTYILTMVVSVVQALIGAGLYYEDARPGSSFHMLYGISLMVFTGAGYVFATRGDSRREALVLGIASAAAVGLIWRASMTAH